MSSSSNRVLKFTIHFKIRRNLAFETENFSVVWYVVYGTMIGWLRGSNEEHHIYIRKYIKLNTQACPTLPARSQASITPVISTEEK